MFPKNKSIKVKREVGEQSNIYPFFIDCGLSKN